MAKIALDVKIEARKFYSRVERMIKSYPQHAAKIIDDAAEAFIRSAVKETPPAGRNLKKRLMQVWNDPNYAKPAAKGRKRTRTAKDRRLYKLIFRRYGSPDKRGRWYFRNKTDAEARRLIKFRGVGQAGWWGTLLRMGKSLGSRIKATANVMAAAVKVNKTTVKLSGNSPKIVIINASNAVSQNRKQNAAAYGYRAADNRFKWWERKLKQDAKK